MVAIRVKTTEEFDVSSPNLTAFIKFNSSRFNVLFPAAPDKIWKVFFSSSPCWSSNLCHEVSFCTIKRQRTLLSLNRSRSKNFDSRHCPPSEHCSSVSDIQFLWRWRRGRRYVLLTAEAAPSSRPCSMSVRSSRSDLMMEMRC